MYRIGEIVSYQTKKNRIIPMVVIYDAVGYIFGYLLVQTKKFKKISDNSDRYLKIPNIVVESKSYNYIDTMNSLTVASSYVIDEKESLNFISIKKLRKKIKKLSKVDDLGDSIAKKLIYLDKIASCRSKIEPFFDDFNMVSSDDLFPNGTGRTKDEFERDNKDIHKKYLLEYIRLNNKQQ